MVLKTEILIYNLSGKRIPSKKFLNDLIKKVLILLKEKNKVHLALVFIDSEASQKLNKHWRNKNTATTVLSFPLKENLPSKLLEKEKILGDIFLCPEEIENQARKTKISVLFFYKTLIVHSLLHLYGYSHHQKKEAQKMEILENKIIGLLNK